MAEKEKKEQVTQTDSKTVEQIITILFALMFLGAIASAIMGYINNLRFGEALSFWQYFMEHIWPVIEVIAAVVSGLCIIGTVNNLWHLNAIGTEEAKFYASFSPMQANAQGEMVEEKDGRWEQILAYTNSDNPSDWRQAIIDADIMLEELLKNLEYHGDTVGDMLKSVDKNDFNTLDEAWEAHKMRNAIAHSGTNFQLTQHETKRIISLFEKVFLEFEVI